MGYNTRRGGRGDELNHTTTKKLGYSTSNFWAVMYTESDGTIYPRMCPRGLSSILDNLNNASLGQRFPWTMRPRDDTSLDNVP